MYFSPKKYFYKINLRKFLKFCPVANACENWKARNESVCLVGFGRWKSGRNESWNTEASGWLFHKPLNVGPWLVGTTLHIKKTFNNESRIVYEAEKQDITIKKNNNNNNEWQRQKYEDDFFIVLLSTVNILNPTNPCQHKLRIFGTPRPTT